MATDYLIAQIYMQDKRARKKVPAYGTKKYPLLYVGIGSVHGNKINIADPNGLYVISQGRVTNRQYRVYVCNEKNGEWVDSPVFSLAY